MADELVGPPGPEGPLGPKGTKGDPGPNYIQIALLHWYEAIATGHAFAVGDGPVGLSFDGAHIWVANFESDNVMKL